jgi:hypothetical protein
VTLSGYLPLRRKIAAVRAASRFPSVALLVDAVPDSDEHITDEDRCCNYGASILGSWGR